jgi:TPR repeat protein
MKAHGIRGDAATAVDWYRKASLAGDRQAYIRLKRLTEKSGG